MGKTLKHSVEKNYRKAVKPKGKCGGFKLVGLTQTYAQNSVV